jgi:hypothetical protein
MKTHILTFGAFVALSSIASGAIVFNDTFDTGTAADAGYYRFGTTGTTLTTDNLDGTLDYAYTGSATARSGIIKSFSEVSLDNTGDSLTFSFTLASGSFRSSENHTFRYAIGNLGNPTAVTGIPVTTDLSSTTPLASGTRQMYQFSAAQGATTGFNALVSGSTSPVHDGSGITLAGLSNDSIAQNVSDFTVTLTFTRTSTGLDINKSYNGNVTTSSLADTNAVYTFNNLAFSMNNPDTVGFTLDNVTVTAVPEPSTYALLAGFMTLGLILWRRRR